MGFGCSYVEFIYFYFIIFVYNNVFMSVGFFFESPLGGHFGTDIFNVQLSEFSQIKVYLPQAGFFGKAKITFSHAYKTLCYPPIHM